ncbi:MAG: AAA family ATPase, partial [Halioglobus sp.]|nr:AAA family ATPase [Halioglobus sp.]
MYHQYFGLTEAPFSIAVNPRYLFMSPRHRDALAHLLYGVGAGGGFILLTGEVGTGKTTINRCLLEQLPHDTDIAIILNPALNAKELLASACDELGIDYDGNNPTLKSLTDELHRYLLANHERGRKTVLLIDEAQHLDFDVLEQIRLLTNLETNSEKLLQIILIGQPELAVLLSRPELRQLNQRITARYNLEPLNLDETAAYIRHRLQVAGMSPDREIFPRRVVRGIYRATRGIPRLINVLCDRMLLGAYGRNKSRVDNGMLRQAVQEVLGSDVAAAPAWRPWGVAVALVLLVAALGFVWMRGGGVVAPAPGVAAPVEPAPAVAAPVRDAVAELEPVAPPAETASVESNSAAGLLTPGEGGATLWTLVANTPPPANTCPAVQRDGVQCVQGEASTWNDIAALDRPVLLDMVTSERFAAETLMLGIDGREAWVLGSAGPIRVALADLAPHWTGIYRYLWRPPVGFDKPLARGARGAVVAHVARRFAELDGMEEPLASELFNEHLEERVRLFQREHALQSDGVVGQQT